MKMHAVDSLAKFAKISINLLHIARTIFFAREIGIRIHQMPDVEHEARIRMGNALQKRTCKLRLLKCQSRPPEIFKEQAHILRYLGCNLVDKLDCPFDDFFIGMSELARIHLRSHIMRDMKDEILRPTSRRLAQILFPAFHPVINIKRAVVGADIFLRAELCKERSFIPAPKIQPRRPEKEMYALDIRGWIHRSIPRRTEHEFDSIESVALNEFMEGFRFILQQVFYIAACIRYIHQFQHKIS